VQAAQKERWRLRVQWAYGQVVARACKWLLALYARSTPRLCRQAIAAGQVICLSGSSGRSTGPHLHFEVHKDGWPVDLYVPSELILYSNPCRLSELERTFSDIAPIIVEKA
jgi:hypothetical protein